MILEIVAIFACVVAGLWIYARWNFGTFEKMGIPVVEYTNPLLGSAPDIYTKIGGLNDVAWMGKYGKIFGMYEGRTPVLYVCEPELVRLICVKESNYFDGKRDFDFGDPILNEMPDFLPLEKWRIMRSLTTPAFSAAKLKLMNLPMRETTLDFVSDIKHKISSSGKGVYEKMAIDHAVHVMLTDLIARAFFSIQIDGRDKKDNAFSQIVLEAMTPPEFKSNPIRDWISMYTTHSFPFLKKLISRPIFNVDATQKFVTLFKQLLEERKRSGVKRNDVFDMIIDWYPKLDTPEFKDAEITELTFICAALVFFVAAQDQLSTGIGGVIYHMTQDPELEKKIYKEIDEVFAKDGKVDHENFSQLHVTNASLSECLRLYTVFHRTERMATKDWKNEEFNLNLKKGTVICIPIWALNRNEAWNEDPDTFNYERFMPENKDKLNVFASTSFGHGPRQCTGKRFAQESMPIILAYMLKELQFKKRSDTEMKILPGGLLMTPHAPIYVDVMKRGGNVAPSF